MRIGTGFAARRTPGWPLAVTLGIHLVLLWGWRVATAPQLMPADPVERTLMLMPVPMPRIVPEFTRPTRPKPPAARTQSDTAEPQAAPVPSAAQPEPESIAEPYADPFALPSKPAAAPEAVNERARRDAGPTDHAMRKGKLSKLEPGDTRWTRFQAALEGAHKDSSPTLTSESYTSPDGVTIYRFRRGGKVFCRTGGLVRPRIGGAEGGSGDILIDVYGGGGAAGKVPCPANAEFKRD